MFQIRGLGAGYTKSATVVHGLDLTVGPRSAVGVIGRNGSGKTCLAQTLIGVLPAHAGEILLDEENIETLSPRDRIRRRLALVPEGRLVFPQLTVNENLQMAAFGAGLKLTVARLDRVRTIFPLLADKDNDRAGTMSGGEQQWLALGRALVQEPSVMILDEPSLGLSPVAISSLASALMVIRDQGVAIVLMEQNPYLLEQLCEDVLLLDQGTVAGHLDFSQGDGSRLIEEAYLGA